VFRTNELTFMLTFVLSFASMKQIINQPEWNKKIT